MKHLLVLLVFIKISLSRYTIHKLEGYDGAICNDGTPAVYYFQQGLPDKWIIYLEGGGFCYDETSCNDRYQSSRNLMSSSSYSNTKTGSGILSNNPTINPYWYNASIIDVMYCSSDSYSGNQKNSDLKWAFMGSVIVESVIQDALKNHGLGLAKEVIFGGSSAGAEGLYPNANRVQKLLGNNIKFLVLLDSGWFLDYDPFHQGNCNTLGECTEQEAMRRGVTHWNPRVDAGCAAAKSPSQLYQCMLGPHAYPYISSPSFVFVWGYDSAGLGHDGIYHIPTSSQELTYANVAASNITKSLAADAVKNYYNPACYYHTIVLNNNWTKIIVNGKRLIDVIYQWTVNPSSSVHLGDSCGSPNCNPTCSVL